MDVPAARKKRFLVDLENEIIDINGEQRAVFNRLRLIIDYYLLQNKTERKKLTDFISSEIASYAKNCDGGHLAPINVKRRLSLDDLYEKYINNANMSRDDDCKIINLDDYENDDEMENGNNDSENEVMEVLLSPEDVALGVNYVDSPHYKSSTQPKQESLLKPKAERIQLPAEEKTASSQPAAPQINVSRLKLKEALFKAKIKKTSPEKPAKKSKSASPERVKQPPKTMTTCKSSSASSEDIFEAIDWSKEEEQPIELGKEAFMRLFGLFTHSHSHYLSKRRTERKRRNCTTTEHRDYYYSKLELFERQYAKHNKRQFLYSPPATRAKKQQRVATDIVLNASGIVSNASRGQGNSNNRPNLEKVCVSCFKKSEYIGSIAESQVYFQSFSFFLCCFTDNLLECKICFGKYHFTCHKMNGANKEKTCPICIHPRRRKPKRTSTQNAVKCAA